MFRTARNRRHRPTDASRECGSHLRSTRLPAFPPHPGQGNRHRDPNPQQPGARTEAPRQARRDGPGSSPTEGGGPSTQGKKALVPFPFLGSRSPSLQGLLLVEVRPVSPLRQMPEGGIAAQIPCEGWDFLGGSRTERRIALVWLWWSAFPWRLACNLHLGSAVATMVGPFRDLAAKL